MKVCPVGARLYHVHYGVIVTFCSVLNAPKKETQITCTVQALYVIYYNWIVKIRNCTCYLISYVIFFMNVKH